MSKPVVAAVLLGGVCASTLAATPVVAADMPIKAPVYRATAAYDWTGLYLGLNAGYSVGRHHSSDVFVQPGNTPDTSQAFTVGPAGFLGGGQLGYNWQSGNWVAGVEGDWQWTGQKDTICISGCNRPGGLGSFLFVEQKLDWLATVRGRLGYAQAGSLWYLTGGGAWASVKENDSKAFAVATAASFSDVKGGWTLGGGVETLVGGNWTAKIEYLYVNLGGTTHSFVYVPFPATQTVRTDVRDHIIRVGLNYRLGEGAPAGRIGAGARPAGLVYKAPAAAIYDWSGLYAGLNAGYSVGRNRAHEAQGEFGSPVNSNQSFTLSPAGWLGGAQLGYNWQSGNWVVGVEGDWQWTGQKDSACITACLPNLVFLTVEQQLRWFATLRGRIGYAHDGVLWYLTGGAAWGRITEQDALSFGPPDLTLASFSHTKGGWTLGGGVETVLTGNWTAKFEYLYIDLGSTVDTFLQAADPTEYQRVEKPMRDHIFRVGVNYRFGSDAVIAKY
jgi:outer membrane immunogenic protein